MVSVDGEALRLLLSEQGQVGWVNTDLFGSAMTADVVVEAHDLICRGHDQMQVVGNHQHPAMVAVADFIDQLVKLGLPGDIHALSRLIQHQ